MRGTQLAPKADKRNPTAADGGSPNYLPREKIVHVAVYKLPNGHNY
jgi:hypothetical protein